MPSPLSHGLRVSSTLAEGSWMQSTPPTATKSLVEGLVLLFQELNCCLGSQPRWIGSWPFGEWCAFLSQCMCCQSMRCHSIGFATPWASCVRTAHFWARDYARDAFSLHPTTRWSLQLPRLSKALFTLYSRVNFIWMVQHHAPLYCSWSELYVCLWYLCSLFSALLLTWQNEVKFRKTQ